MAYIIDSSVLPITYSADALTITLTDDIDYSVTPLRTNVRVFVQVDKMKADSTVKQAATVTPNTGDAQTDSAWSWPNIEDGYYKISFAIIKEAYSGGDTYAIYEAVYDSSTDIVYRSKAGSNTGNALSDTAWWEVISDPARTISAAKGTATESTNAESIVYNRVLFPQAEKDFASYKAKEAIACCGDCETDNHLAHVLRDLIDGAEIADSRSVLVDGERICRKLEALLDNAL